MQREETPEAHHFCDMNNVMISNSINRTVYFLFAFLTSLMLGGVGADGSAFCTSISVVDELLTINSSSNPSGGVKFLRGAWQHSSWLFNPSSPQLSHSCYKWSYLSMDI